MKQKGFAPIIILIFIALAVVGYFGYKNYWPKISKMVSPQNYDECVNSPGSIIETSFPAVCVAKSGARFTEPVSVTPPLTPIVSSPSKGIKVTSPMEVIGIVPAGWMFEGVFPIKLVDLNKKLIVQGQAKEKFPGSWQTGQPVDFTSSLFFTTNTKGGFLVLENDNPSGDPAKSITFEVPVNINCTPRPSCLDATPRCMIPETSDMCPPSTTPLQKACTQEAKLCPDGSSVGRTGPNCEFAPCPQ